MTGSVRSLLWKQPRNDLIRDIISEWRATITEESPANLDPRNGAP